MNRTLLTDVLRHLRLRGTVYFRAGFQCPWGMAVPSKDHAIFHVVVSGRAFILLEGERPVELEAGDIVLLPRGASHELLSSPDSAAIPARKVVREIETGGRGSADLATTSTCLVCGHFSYDQTVLHPLFETLPGLVRVHPRDSVWGEWLATAAKLAATESEQSVTTDSVIVDRLAEVLILQTLRLYLEQASDESSFVAATVDRYIGPALALLHGDPSYRWTVAELADRVACSQSVLSRRFREVVGESPMRYLRRWRMLVARDLLTEGACLVDAAAAVGYRSEFAFAKAFKRTHGIPPGEYRRLA